MSGWRPQNKGNRGTNREAFIVSRRLRDAGYAIAQSADQGKRAGVFVKNHNPGVKVVFDLDYLTERDVENSDQMMTDLRSWGYEVERYMSTDNISIYATKKEE